MIKSLLFFINSIVAVVLLLLYGVSFLPPSTIPVIPAITLLTPVFLVLNLLFFFYWVLGLSKKSILSLITLLICLPFVFSFLQFNSSSKDKEIPTNQIKILSYNSHYFKRTDTNKLFIKEFTNTVNEIKPDILFFQEATLSDFKTGFETYKYKESTKTNKKGTGANPILSKYPIVNKGYVGVNDIKQGLNALFADVKIDGEIIRCYNLHLTSYRLKQNPEELKKTGVENIANRLNTVFKYQENQVSVIARHIADSPYPVIFCGDFNNTSFSYVYRKLKNAGNLIDTFVEKGKGLGTTLVFKYFPTRIDHILVSDTFKVVSHEVLKTKNLSDHYPVISEITFND